jgi:hypothetical protein
LREVSARVIEELARAPAPGFRCRAAGRESGGTFLARVGHILRLAASSNGLRLIRRRLGAFGEQVAAFYQQHNGFILYRDSLSDAAGVELLPVEEWDEATADMRDWFGHLADEPEEDPDHIATGIAIATVPHSGNYFVMPVEGPTAGKVFYADHDGWYESAFAENFDDFLVQLTKDPVPMLNLDFGCYTRYSDGKTSAQWIPEEYFPDVSKAKL